MSEDMTILRQNKPAIAEFIDDWKNRYENRKIDLTQESGQAEFYEAMVEMARHIAHVSDSVTLNTLVNNLGVDTVYVKATNSTQ